MIHEPQYVVLSLELHLFFGRIMKEHAIFLEAGFTPANSAFAKTADGFKKQFETILHQAVSLGNGIIRPEVVASGEIITDHTLGSERQTQAFTGIEIDQSITRLEEGLFGAANPQIPPDLVQRVKALNTHALHGLDGLIRFKTEVLDQVLSCRAFTTNYPLLIDHIRREAEMYRDDLNALECGKNPASNTKETALFWDQIMLEHALFIRGSLDPTENALIHTSNDFAKVYNQLLSITKTATDASFQDASEQTLQETLKFRDFKDAGTKGIAACKVRSTILPLLADHVLREASRFVRLLKQFEN